MAVLAEHQTSVVVDGETPIVLPVVSGSLELDEEWTPYVQAALECPLGDGTILEIDPQASDIWATLEARRLLGRIDRISDLTRRYRNQPLSTITAEFNGKTIADVSATLYHDYEIPGHPKRSEARSFRLMLRELVVDWATATVRIALASGESRLGDWMHMSTTTNRIPGADMVAKINWILNLAGFPEGLSSWPASVPIDAEIGDEAMRAPASSASEFITQLTRQHGLMCWCDEDGKWHLAENRNSATLRTLTSTGADRSVVNAVEKRSRDDGWVTAVMLVYTWDGATHYDIASPYVPLPEKALVLRYEKPFPGTGRAAQMLEQLRSRGRALELLAVSTYAVTPGEQLTYSSPRGAMTGRVAAVRWAWPTDEMSIRLREVEAA